MESLPQRPPPSRPLAESVRAWLQWFGLVRLSVTAVAVLAIGAGAFWLLRTPPAPVEQFLPMAGAVGPSGSNGLATDLSTDQMTAVTTAVTSVDTAMPPAEIVVHVAGAVARPGIVPLRAGDRVIDALTAAGGTTPDADVEALNFAAVLRDGDRLYVPHLGQPVPSVVSASGGAPAEPDGTVQQAGPIDLNRATAEQLDGLPGIGPATAAAIVTYRDEHGPFGTVDDLLDVRGIGTAKLDAIRSLVTL